MWAYALAHGFTIVSKDTDFSEMSMVRGSPPKVIWIKRGNCSTNDIEAILRRDHRLIAELEQNETLRILLLF